MVGKILAKVKEFFVTRTVGYYIALAAAVLSIVLSIVYACGYDGTNYMSWAAFALTLVAGLAFIGLSVSKYTERYAALIMGLLDFIAFLLFIHAVYMYFSTVFYGGFSADLLGEVDPSFYACTVLYLVTIIASNVCVYLKNSKTAKAQPENTASETEEKPETVEEGEQL